MLNKISCPSCGASDFERLEKGKIMCKYCNSIFSADYNSATNPKSFEDKKISGDMMRGLKFAVHKKLVVSGDMNHITISSNLTDDIVHVSTLRVSGDMNKLTVTLLDGATFENNGDMNKFK